MGKVPFHVSVAACAAVLLPSIGQAASDADVEALRAELAQVKADYAERLAKLEAQIAQLQPKPDVGATAAVDQAVVAAPPAAPEAAPAPAAARSASTFNPAISLILAGNYSNLSNSPEDYAIQGFVPAGDEIGPGERGFNLGETELTMAASIDPYFMGSVTVAITPENEIEVEEAYFRTLALGEGFTIKGGQFFSSLGYLNEVHGHAWDFVDQPLVYQAFFGGQMAVQGLQLKWIAPLDFLVELGVESGNGDYFPGTRQDRNGLNGVIAYGHVGADLGDSIAWRAGLSYVDLDAEDREFEDRNAAGDDVLNAFSGSSETWVRGCGTQVDGAGRPAPAVRQAAGRVHAAQGGWRPQLHGRRCLAGRRLLQRPVRVVRAGRLPVPATLAVRRALRLARRGQHEDRTGAGRRPHRGRFPAAAARLADAHQPDARLEPERVLATACAVRVGRCKRGTRRTSSSSCSTSTRSAPTAPTSSRSSS